MCAVTWLVAFAVSVALLGEIGREQSAAVEAKFDFDLNELPPEALEPADDELSYEEDDDHDDGQLSLKSLLSAKPRSSATDAQVSGGAGKLPDYFSFSSFKQRFNKQYGSIGEMLVRQKVFIQRCIRIMKARVLYRLGRTTYLQNVNEFSDRSEDELGAMFMSMPPLEFRPSNQTEAEYLARMDAAAHGRRRIHPTNELDMSEPVSRATLDGQDQESEPEEEAFELVSSELELDFGAELDRETLWAIKDELASVPVRDEALSRASLYDDAGKSGQKRKRVTMPWPGQQSAPVEGDEDLELVRARLGEAYLAPSQEQVAAAAAGAIAQPDAGASLQLDWSKHPCFHEVYQQGEQCGKCYVMAATSLAEFYKCSEVYERVQRRKFSKDYVLDCSPKFTPTALGCLGGSLLDTLRFISVAGAFNIKSWRIRRQQELTAAAEAGHFVADKRCPLPDAMKLHQKPQDGAHSDEPVWGDIKVDVVPVAVSANQWLDAVRDGPLTVSVQMPAAGLHEYSGGVHDGAGCATSGNWHAMILVGFGRDPRTGKLYWRFRNSWGAAWGDEGHLNMAMDAPAQCYAGGVRLYRRTSPL